MQRSISRYSVFATAVVLILAVFAAGAAAAGKPSITVKGPASVVNFTRWTVTVSGFSGPYKYAMVAEEKGEVACRKPESASNKQTKPVKKEHKFKLTFSSEQGTGKPPQIFTRCVYLFSGAKYIVKVSHYQLVPNKEEEAEAAAEG
jgi:hypothetical protein